MEKTTADVGALHPVASTQNARGSPAAIQAATNSNSWSDATATPASRVRWGIFVVIFLITLINLVDRISLSIAMPTIAKEFVLSPTIQGVILSSFFWSYAILQIPAGLLIDRLGPRRVVAGATLLWGAFQMLLAFSTGGLSLLLLRLGLGGAEAPLFPAGSKLNALWLSSRERGRGAVLMDAGSPLGAAIGGIVISQLILILHSWRTAFFVAGALTMLMGLVAWLYLRDDPAQHPRVNREELALIREKPLTLSSGRSHVAFPVRAAMAMSFGRAGWAMIFFGLVTWGPSYLAQARGFDLRVLGASTFLIFFSGALGSLSGGFLCDALVQRGFRRGPAVKSMITVSGLATLLVFACLPHITAPVPAVAVLCVASFLLMWGSLYWSLPSLLVDVNQVGILGAVMNCAGSIGGIAIPIITGLILQRTASFDMVLYFYSACAVVYMLGTLMINFKNA